jgi:hypothetical protein
LFDLSAENPESATVSVPSYPAKISSAQFDSTSTWLAAGSKEGMSAANLSNPYHIRFRPLAGYKGGTIGFSSKGQWLGDSTELFLELLERAIDWCPGRISVLLTIRAEFEPRFAQSALKQRWAAMEISSSA